MTWQKQYDTTKLRKERNKNCVFCLRVWLYYQITVCVVHVIIYARGVVINYTTFSGKSPANRLHLTPMSLYVKNSDTSLGHNFTSKCAKSSLRRNFSLHLFHYCRLLPIGFWCLHKNTDVRRLFELSLTSQMLPFLLTFCLFMCCICCLCDVSTCNFIKREEF